MTKFLLFEAFVYFWHRWNNSLFLTRRWCYSVCISLRLNYACSLGNPNVLLNWNPNFSTTCHSIFTLYFSSIDANPTAVAMYAVALVKKDQEEADLKRQVCNDLSVFLGESESTTLFTFYLMFPSKWSWLQKNV